MPETVVEFHQVVFSYDRAEVLHQVSFALHKGEIVGPLGPNGAGKSTTIKLITGIHPRSHPRRRLPQSHTLRRPRYRRLPHRRGVALMNPILEALARYLRGPAVSRLFRRFAIDPHRYWLLIDLFGTLTDRHEMGGHLGRDGISLKTAPTS